MILLHYKLRLSRYDPGSLSIMRSLDALAKYDPDPQTEDLHQAVFNIKEDQLAHFVQNIYRALNSLCDSGTYSSQDGKNLASIYLQTVWYKG